MSGHPVVVERLQGVERLCGGDWTEGCEVHLGESVGDVS